MVSSDSEKGVAMAGDATLVIRLGYRGAGFAGFAEQPGVRTVAGELRRALETALRRPCEPASSRAPGARTPASTR